MRLMAILAALFVLATASSCTTREGWAIILWPPEGSALKHGSMVPIYFLSNITKTYAVGVPGSRAKEEVELWRVERFKTKGKAKAAAAAYAGLASQFGVATRDGLLLRDKPDNKAEQVYRLKIGQEVKLLEMVKGELVETGGVPLQGDWFRALAGDGTVGYIFSNQLTLWNAKDGPKPRITIDKPEADETLSKLFGTVWRPDYFDSMVASGLLDLAAYQPKFGVFSYAVRKQIRIERPDFSKAYNYDAIVKKDDGSYELQPSGATFAFTKADGLLFTPPLVDVPPAALEKAKEEQGEEAVVSYSFVSHKSDIQEVIAAEERKRLSRLAAFVAKGERYESESYGVFIATRSARFTWVAYGALSPSVIPEGSGGTGAIVMDMYLSPELAGSWDGAFTLYFEGGTKPAVPFAYRLDGRTLSLAYLPPGAVKNAIVSAPEGLTTVATLTGTR
jgi:hypothetical protein